MIFPLSLGDITPLLAVTAIILILTSEIITLLPDYSRRILVNLKWLRALGVSFALAFFAIVIIQFLPTL